MEKIYDLIIRLFNIIVHYMNELALRALWLRWASFRDELLFHVGIFSKWLIWISILWLLIASENIFNMKFALIPLRTFRRNIVTSNKNSKFIRKDKEAKTHTVTLQLHKTILLHFPFFPLLPRIVSYLKVEKTYFCNYMDKTNKVMMMKGYLLCYNVNYPTKHFFRFKIIQSPS